jgi:hypothetical protein
MQYGDHVDVTVARRTVGPGKVIAVGHDRAKVVVRLPIDDDFVFEASLIYFRSLNAGSWHIDMPAQTSRVFFPEE